MDCPAKSWQVRNQLCELLYWPGPPSCEVKCRHLFEKWLIESEEVRSLEAEARSELSLKRIREEGE